MDDERDFLDRELSDLGAQWRAEYPADFVPREIERGSSSPTGWLLSAAAAVVVIGTVVGALALSPGGKNDPADSPNPSPEVVNRLDCARPAERQVRGAPVVPEGAIAARLCGRTVNASGFDEAWPVDTLNEGDTKELIAALNHLEPYQPSDAIDCVVAHPFKIVLRYPDGSRVWVHSPCQTQLQVRGGTGKYGNAGSISDLALRLIKHERQTRTTLTHPIPPVCPAKWQTVGGTVGAATVQPGDDVAVTACQYRLESRASNAQGRLDWQAVVNAPASLLTSARTGSSTDPCAGKQPDLEIVQRVLLVRDRFGDINVVSTSSCIPNTLFGAPQYPSSPFSDTVTHLFPARLQKP